MKKSFFFLLFTIYSSIIFSQSEVYYSVKIGTFLNAQKQDFSEILPLGFVFAESTSNNLYEVFIGVYNNKKDAASLAAKIVEKGYINAFVQDKFNNGGQQVTLIQMATKNLGQEIDWAEFMDAGDLYSLITEKQIKILTGPFPSVDAAKDKLEVIKSLGFKDAFVKTTTANQLHKLNNFELGSVKMPLIPLSFDNKPASSTGENNKPASYDFIDQKSNPTTEDFTARSIDTKIEASLPAIRTKIKRSSVLTLQEFLKLQQTYNGSLDGYYGTNTENAYKNWKFSNQTYKRYSLWSQQENSLGKSSNSPFQQTLNSLDNMKGAVSVLEKSNEPLASAYRAYILFKSNGPGVEVNYLMNAAIKGSYPSFQPGTLTPVDPTATYSYNDLNQIILHLLFVHSAPTNNKFEVPCWLFAAHPAETEKAGAVLYNFPGFEYNAQSCDPFSSWPEIKLLQSIAVDMNAEKTLNYNRISMDAAARSDLFLTTVPLISTELKALEDWNNAIWAGIDSWSLRDPLNLKLASTLKGTYFQTYILLEDFYMDKGFKTHEAKGLALATLHTLVGYHLERFL